ncbi:MAG: ZIP family metal transporter [Bacteroidia bacterium]
MLLLYFILFAAVFSSGFVFSLVAIPKLALKLLLAFTGSLLFSIAVLDLVPEVYGSLGKTAGIYILVGFFLQIILEFFSHGIEHGHTHHGEGRTFVIMMLISLCIHSLLEGMAVSYHPQNSNSLIDKGLYIGILLHHVPIAIALMTVLTESHVEKMKRLIPLAVFACMSPLGMYLGAHTGFLTTMSGGAFILNVTTGLVAGILLHISTTILFESSEDHRFNLLKFITVILGALLTIFIIL